jgi:(2R)-sulfolactate sulfo-lyase subunit alpha
MKPHFLTHDEHDNVGVAVVDIKTGEDLVGSCLENGAQIKIKSKDAIPLGHKVALKELKKGDDVVKYGIAVGMATQAIAAGQHAHVHNVKSKRW